MIKSGHAAPRQQCNLQLPSLQLLACPLPKNLHFQRLLIGELLIHILNLSGRMTKRCSFWHSHLLEETSCSELCCASKLTFAPFVGIGGSAQASSRPHRHCGLADHRALCQQQISTSMVLAGREAWSTCLRRCLPV